MSFTNFPLDQNVAGGLGGQADAQLARDSLRNQVQPSKDIMVSRTSGGTFLTLRDPKGGGAVTTAAPAPTPPPPAVGTILNLNTSATWFEAYPRSTTSTLNALAFGGLHPSIQTSEDWAFPIPSQLAALYPDDVYYDTVNGFAWPKYNSAGTWTITPSYFTMSSTLQPIMVIPMAYSSSFPAWVFGPAGGLGTKTIRHIDINIDGRVWSHS